MIARFPLFTDLSMKLAGTSWAGNLRCILNTSHWFYMKRKMMIFKFCAAKRHFKKFCMSSTGVRKLAFALRCKLLNKYPDLAQRIQRVEDDGDDSLPVRGQLFGDFKRERTFSRPVAFIDKCLP